MNKNPSKSRSQKSLKNVTTAFIGQSVGLLVSFFARIVFVNTLGANYLGVNGLFSNIMTILALFNLGVGEAINFSLYKPLARRDFKTCQTLMHFYKKIYTIIGILILTLGICLSPFARYFASDASNIPNINLIFLLFVVDTSVSYFFSYKRNLIIADQNRYIATVYRYGIFSLVNLVQVIYLLMTKDYFGFLGLQISGTLLENILVSQRANKLYPFLKDKKNTPLSKELKIEIAKNTKAMMMHKIGGTIVTSTDNILISKIVDLSAVGKYSNYLLITSALDIILNQIFNSVVASVGNLFASKDSSDAFNIFKSINFFNFWVCSILSVGLLCLFNPFIELWVGKSYLFSADIVLMLVINFYITSMRKSVLMFREASGLFYKDRWKAIVEACINLIASILLAIKFGVLGIFIGTFISSITTCVWVEPYILYKYKFNKRVYLYFKTYFKYLFVTAAIALTCFYLCSLISYYDQIGFMIKLLIVLILPNLIMFCLFRRTDEFQYFYKKILKK